jgi:hypothetical protein
MKTVMQYRSDAGNTFDNEHDAHKDDLLHWLCAAAGNDPIARQVAKRVDAELDTLAAIIAGMKRTATVAEPELPLGFKRLPDGRIAVTLPPDNFAGQHIRTVGDSIRDVDHYERFGTGR